MSTDFYVFSGFIYLSVGMLYFLATATGKFNAELQNLSKSEAALNLFALFMVCLACWWIVFALKPLFKPAQKSIHAHAKSPD